MPNYSAASVLSGRWHMLACPTDRFRQHQARHAHELHVHDNNQYIIYLKDNNCTWPNTKILFSRPRRQGFGLVQEFQLLQLIEINDFPELVGSNIIWQAIC